MNAEKKTRNPFWVLGKSGAYTVLIVGLIATLLPFFYILVSPQDASRLFPAAADAQTLHHDSHR
jgi:hypothetical protein